MKRWRENKGRGYNNDDGRNKERKGRNGKTTSCHRDVNLMFGWGIFYLRLLKLLEKSKEHLDNEKTEKLKQMRLDSFPL